MKWVCQKNLGRFTPESFRPGRFALGRFAPILGVGCFAPGSFHPFLIFLWEAGKEGMIDR